MRLAVIAFVLALFTAPPALAQKGGASAADQLTIRTCNQSGRNAFTAVIYRTGGTWRSEGWWRVDNGNCLDIAVSDHLRFYVFAEEVGNTEYFWGGNFEHCILRPGPYEYVVDPDSKECQAGQDSVMFAEWVADQYGTFTWTLEP